MSKADISTTPIRSRRAVLAGMASTAVIPTTATLAAAPITAAATALADGGDAVYAMIERHKGLSDAYSVAVNHPGVGAIGADRSEVAEEVAADAGEALLDHAEELFAFQPLTVAAVAALLRYVSVLAEWELPGGCVGEIKCRSSAQQRPRRSRPSFSVGNYKRWHGELTGAS
jgi:hypothetical protein